MKQKIFYIALIGVVLLTACGTNSTDATPTLDANAVQTQAVEMFSASLTQTAVAHPTIQFFPTLTASPTIASFATNALPTISQPTIAPTHSCYSLQFVGDVTIPDNTPMAPSQAFTKTWKLKNNGTCAWDAGFKFSFTGGDAMNGAVYTVPASVAANAIADISVAMIAPNKAGAIRGNWRMSTAGGQFFGDEVYVVVLVGGATLTPTKTAITPAATATATNTPNPSYP